MSSPRLPGALRSARCTALGIAIVAAAAPAAATAQGVPPVFRRLEDPRLVGTRVYAVTQGHDGRLLIGTRDGFFRWDGVVLDEHPARSEDGAPLDHVRAILPHSDGSVLAAGPRGLYRWDGERTTKIALHELPRGANPAISALVEDPDGTVWIAAAKGLWHWSKGSDVARPFTANALPSGTAVRLLARAPDGRVWLVARGRLLVVDQGTFVTAFDPPCLRQHAPPLALWPSEDRVVLATELGIFEFDVRSHRETEVVLPSPPGRRVRELTGAIRDAAGNLWLSDQHANYLWVVRAACTVAVSEGDTGLEGELLGGFTDHERGFWLATTRGLYRTGPAHVTSTWLALEDPTTGQPVSVLCAHTSPQGELWIGTVNNGLLRRRGDRTLPVPLPGASGAAVHQLDHEPDGALLAATGAGLFRVPPDGPPERCWVGEPGEEATTLAPGDGGHWFATHLNGEWRSRVYWRPTGAPAEQLPFEVDGRVLSLLGHAGRLFVVTDDQGLLCFDGALEPARFPSDPASGPPFDPRFVRIVVPAGTGLWAVGADSLWHLELDPVPRAERRPDVGPDLSIESLWRVGSDLWWTFDNGLARLGEPHETFRDPGTRGPLVSHLGATSPTEWRGSVVFPGSGGLLHLDLSPPRPRPFPRVLLTSVRETDGTATVAAALDRSGALPVAHLPEVPGSGLEIRVSSLTFAHPEDQRYRFVLESEGRRQVHETAALPYLVLHTLPPGEWTLSATTSASEGSWSPPLPLLTIRAPDAGIADRWWLLALAALAGLALLGFRAAARRRRPVPPRLSIDVLNADALDDVVQLALEHAVSAAGADRGRAFVRAATGTATGYRLRGAVGWRRDVAACEDVTRDEITAWLAGTTERAEGVHVGRADPWSARAPAGLRPARCLALRIDTRGSAAAAWLLLDQDRVRTVDPRHLAALREPVAAGLETVHLLERLIVRDRLKSEIVVNSAHDLRSPLTAVDAAADMLHDALRRGTVDHVELAHGLDAVRQAVTTMSERLGALVREHSRDAADVPLLLEEHDLAHIVRRQVGLYRMLARRKEIELRFVEPGALPRVPLDRPHIERVVDNLLSNAIKFTEPGGGIVVSVERTPEGIATHVRDTGLGLSPDEVGRLFSPGVTLHAATRGEAGSGLGLLIVRHIVERHGGTLRVRSERGVGSTFSFLLPTEAPADSDATPRPPTPRPR